MSDDLLDLLREFSGADVRFMVSLEFAQAWDRAIEGRFGSQRCRVIGFEDLLTAKRSAGRPQDLADVAALERLAKLKR